MSLGRDKSQLEDGLRLAWGQLLSRYTSGKIVLARERDLEGHLTSICKELIAKDSPGLIGNQEVHLDKKVDLRTGVPDRPLLVELKLYHDPADWKESSTMTNTVESDLKFAKGREDVHVGIIDTIPSTTRPSIPFRLEWQLIRINEAAFQQHYANIAPQSSPRREQEQRAVLVKGSELATQTS